MLRLDTIDGCSYVVLTRKIKKYCVHLQPYLSATFTFQNHINRMHIIKFLPKNSLHTNMSEYRNDLPFGKLNHSPVKERSNTAPTAEGSI